MNKKRAAMPFSTRVRLIMKERFNLRDDKADDAEIESRIRESIELRGATPWILVFAIFVASVGLNVQLRCRHYRGDADLTIDGPHHGRWLGRSRFRF